MLLAFFIKTKNKKSTLELVQPFLSVIIPFRNETGNLPDIINSLNEQNYPKELFEIVFVDDHSSDDGVKLVEHFVRENKNVKILLNKENPKVTKGKKSAIDYGINNAQGEVIVLTDADCTFSENYLSSIAKHYQHNASAVIGYSPFIINKSFISLFEQFENYKTSFLMKAFFGLGKPYMCFGRNFSYRKDVYNELNGFTNIEKSLSGDDDLFLQMLASYRRKIIFSEDKDSIVLTRPAKNLKDFIRKKTRHLSASKYYRFNINILLAVYYIGSIVNFGALITTAIFLQYDLLYLSLINYLLLFFQLLTIMLRIKQKYNIILLIIFEPIYCLYLIIIGVLSRIKKVSW